MGEQQEDGHFFIAAVGASSENVSAISRLVANLPYPTSNLAVIIAQHFDDHYTKQLLSQLEKSTLWPVLEVQDGLKVQAGNLYLTPVGHQVTIKSGQLRLEKCTEEAQDMPLDIFFESLATERQNFAIGLLLSGTGTDGRKGAQAIKTHQGYVLAQIPDETQDEHMTGLITQPGYFDKILLIEEISKELQQFISKHQKVKDDGGNINEDSLHLIFDLLTKKTGTNFSRYKPSTIKRRLNRRLEMLKLKSLQGYHEHIRDNPEEIDQLFKTVLIGVTEFFRDQQAFDTLKKYLGNIIREKSAGDSIRIWSVGCATGEEPYSIAILLEELLEGKTGEYSIQIFATDIDEVALSSGRKGCYSEEQVKNLSSDRLSRYFVPVEGGYEVKKNIRQMVLFSKHDITADPPFIRLDVVSCRNLLIYFDHALQKEIIPVFHYALKEEGYLLLGKSENVSDLTDLFGKESTKHKIFYRKKGAHNKLRYSLYRRVKIEENKKEPPRRQELSVEEMARETLVQTFEHPYVVIDDHMDVVLIKGKLQPFVDLEEGSINANVLKIIDKAFHMEIRTLFAKTKKDSTTHKSNVVRFASGTAHLYTRLSMKPLLYSKNNSKYYLIIFEHIEESLRFPMPPQEQEAWDEDLKAMRIIELEQELSATKEHLHTFTEELETTNEELQSLNEELQSANEELKSANEELETSNEELHSANEELSTANAELAHSNEQLQIKENELIRIKEDLEFNRENFYLALENSNIILFHQDSELRYSWFYNAYSKIPREKIIGKNDLEIYDTLGEDVLRLHQSKEEVLLTAHEVQIEIRIGGKWYDLKIKPILKHGKVTGINGVGIDITDRKTSADIVERNQSILSNIINQGEDHIIAVSKDFKVLAINENAKHDLFHRLSVSVRLGDHLLEKLKSFPERQNEIRDFFERTFRGEKVYLDTYTTTGREGKGKRYYDGVFFPITDLQGKIIGGANIDREVTERILLEQQVQEITKRSANLVGDEFFKDLTDQLATLFHMGYVYVGVFQEDGKAIRTLAFRINGVLVENFEYGLRDTPCAMVANNNRSYHMEQVRKKFPYDDKLQRWNAESYVGVPITSPHTEKSIGILVMMDQKPWKDTPYTDYLLTLQSIRAGAELERMSAEQRIKEKSLQLENVSNNVPGVIYEIKQTKEGFPYYAYISEACESIFGITQEDFLKGTEGLLPLIHEEDKPAYLKEQKRAVTEVDNFHFEGRVRTKNDQIKWVKLNSRALKQEDGTVSWYGFIDDITQIKAVEEALEEAKNEAEKAARAKEDFLATMSHEIRTPLNAIIGLSNLLLKKNPRPDQLENFKALRFSSESLMNLINDILDYSKMEAGKVEIETSDYNIKLLLHSIRQAHLLYAEERNNALEINIKEQVPEMVKGDQVKLAQVLNNLVSNANKFTQAGTVRVEVGLQKEQNDDVYLHFAVKDTGIGISEENINKIFEKFTQADSSTVRHYGGTGLGLSITKALLEMQDSEIKVESKLGEGSVFSFVLKQQKGIKHDEIQPATTHKLSEEKAEGKTEKQIKILLVEDVAINRMVVQQFFEEWWEIPADEATNGIEAIEMVQQKSYDIILMDIRMPEMDGYEASEAIRKLGSRYEKIPIIALTADTTAEFNNDKRARYINDVITKPFVSQDLYAKIVKYTATEDVQLNNEVIYEHHKLNNGSLELDFDKAEEAFKETPDRIVKFYDMAVRSLVSYRDNYLKALHEQDKKLISDAMHKTKLLIDMLGLNTFYEKMYSTRRKMEAGSPMAVIEEEGEKISQDIDEVLLKIQERIDIIRKSL